MLLLDIGVIASKNQHTYVEALMLHEQNNYEVWCNEVIGLGLLALQIATHWAVGLP